MDEIDIREDFCRQELIEATKTEATINRERFEHQLEHMSNVWGHSELGLEAKRAAMTMLSTKTGMYARVPLICKGDRCPYTESCALLEYDLTPVGEPCPIETAMIELEYANYFDEFDLSNSSFTDNNLVSELINIDVMLARAKALISKEQNPIIDVVSGVSESGEAYTHPEVSKTIELYERLEKRRESILQLMMATRKDKKNIGKDDNKSPFDMFIDSINEQEFVIETRPDNI